MDANLEIDSIFPYFRDPEEFPPSDWMRARYGDDIRWFGVREAIDTSDWDAWNGELAAIQGIGIARVHATERYAHCPPWRDGERISIVVTILT